MFNNASNHRKETLKNRILTRITQTNMEALDVKRKRYSTLISTSMIVVARVAVSAVHVVVANVNSEINQDSEVKDAKVDVASTAVITVENTATIVESIVATIVVNIAIIVANIATIVVNIATIVVNTAKEDAMVVVMVVAMDPNQKVVTELVVPIIADKDLADKSEE